MTLNLRELAHELAEKMSMNYEDVKALKLAADGAEEYAHDLESLIDGQDDHLAELLTPIVKFLKTLSGVKDEGELTPILSPATIGDETNKKRLV